MLFAVALLAVQGCASSTHRSETVVTETMQPTPAPSGNMGNFSSGQSSAEAGAPSGEVPVQKTTEVREERTTHESHGVLSTTLHFIGQILAFPFKIIAGAIEFIF